MGSRSAAATQEWDVLRVMTLLMAIGMIWPVQAFLYAASPAPAPPMADVVAYSGGIAPGWQDWSWAEHDNQSRGRPFHNRPVMRFTPKSWQGVYLHIDNLDSRDLTSLWVWVNGGYAGAQHVSVCTVDANKKFGVPVDLGRYCMSGGGRIPANRWALAVIPISVLRARGGRITGVVFQEAAGKTQPMLYLADIVFKGSPARPAGQPVSITIDTASGAHTISPLIYGLAGASPAIIRDLRITCLRWGGNPNTRYNWERGNCWNAARDWEFRNGNYGKTTAEDRLPSGVADRAIEANRAAGAETLLTIPTIGFVARDDNNATRSTNVPREGGLPAHPGSDAIAGYDPAANRRTTSVPSFARKRGPFADPPDLTDGAVFQDEWVAHLVRKFGRAANGGVKFYAMDNEPDLWASTHTDIHPVLMGYDDLLSTFLEYGTAVKDVDPTAQITGPVAWGWTAYMNSPRDQGHWLARPDRRAHGDEPFIPWFLSAVRKHDDRAGRRTLDVLDIHYYPQANGVYGGKTDAATNAVRLRSTRSLWDSEYRDESWIEDTVQVIPRMRGWIDRYYPGTKLGITEWNWGADNTVNGALAAAECLGIFGRERVDIANYWTAPPPRSPGYYAFKMFRNADGRGHGFGDRSVYGMSSAPDDVSCFASVDTASGETVAMLINKLPARAAVASVTVRGGASARASLWRFDGSAPDGIAPLGEMASANLGRFRFELPAYSITLARFH